MKKKSFIYNISSISLILIFLYSICSSRRIELIRLIIRMFIDKLNISVPGVVNLNDNLKNGNRLKDYYF